MIFYKIKYLKFGEINETFEEVEIYEEIFKIIEEKYKKNGFTVIHFEPAIPPLELRLKKFYETFLSKFLKKRQLNKKIFITVLKQLKSMVKAGIPIDTAIKEINKNIEDKLIKEIFDNILIKLNMGGNISDGLKDYEEVVGNLVISMFILGEKTGEFINVLDKLISILEQIEDNRKKIKSALRSPLITISFAIIAFVLIIKIVVPKFKNIFEEFHSDLPLPTKMLLGLEYIFSHYLFLVVFFLVSLFLLFKFIYKYNSDFKYRFDKFKLKIPIIGNLILNYTLYQFFYILQMLLKSGIPLVEALVISKKIIDNDFYKEKIDKIITAINQGKSLSEIIEEENFVDFIALKMIKGGEEGGELTGMLKEVSDYYKENFENIVNSIESYITPIVTAFIAGIVLFIALGVFLPLWNLMQVVMKQ